MEGKVWANTATDNKQFRINSVPTLGPKVKEKGGEKLVP